MDNCIESLAAGNPGIDASDIPQSAGGGRVEREMAYIRAGRGDFQTPV
jgi:hypothetical protein